MQILNGLIEGKSLDEILKRITSKKILEKEQMLREAIKNSLDPAKVFMIQTYLGLIEKRFHKKTFLHDSVGGCKKNHAPLEVPQGNFYFGFFDHF